MSKKEGLKVKRDLAKLERNLGGIKNLEKLPSVIFVIDTKKEHIAVTEANRLHIPVVAVVDTNCDPDVIDYVIPGNDDAIRSANLMCRVISDAVNEGRELGRRRNARPGTRSEDAGARGRRPRRRARRARPSRRRSSRSASARPRPPPRPSSARSRSGPSRPRPRPSAAARPRTPPKRRRRRHADAAAPTAAATPPPPSTDDRHAGRHRRSVTMADISAKDVAALRKITGAGMMDCKKALAETDGDIERAKDWLREKGIAGAAKQAGRDAERRRDRGARRRQRRRARRAQLRDRLRRQGRRVQAGRRRARAARGRARRARPRHAADQRRVGRRLREGSVGHARREDRARPRRPVRDHRRPASTRYKHIQNERGVVGVLVELGGVDPSNAQGHERSPTTSRCTSRARHPAG